MTFFKNLFLTNRFFYGLAIVIFLTVLSFPFRDIFVIAKASAVVFLILCCVDVLLLFGSDAPVVATREVPARLSLADQNPIRLLIVNRSKQLLAVDVIDELPEYFQERNFTLHLTLAAGAAREHVYTLRPVSRGIYAFGNVLVYATTRIGVVKRRTPWLQAVNVPVYPSLLQMKKYEMRTFTRTISENGVKKIRRVGHSYEFDHIKPYTRGNDYRSINWRATGRRAQLMVNQYEDETSQQVYCIIDKSRVMHMPFQGLSLFDYAVNATLVMANIVLGKQDKAGLITFAENPKTMIAAARDKSQLKKIMDALYAEREGSWEANYELAYIAIRQVVSSRSLLLLYTNFESRYALDRALPQLRKLKDQHLLVVIIFENTEITSTTSAEVETLEDIYTQVTAEHYALTKIQIVQQLRQYGILALLTRPENLTVATINQYLEIKSRGMI